MLLLIAVLWMWFGRSRHPARPAPVQETANPVAVVAPSEPEHGQEDVGGSGSGFTVVSSRPAPRPGIPPSAELLEEARLHLVAGGRESSCGPYSLLEDMADPLLLETCNLLATELDDTYRQRLGVAPLREPAATILLFSHRNGYRDFSEQQGIQASGYAAHTSPSQGYAAIWADSSRPDDFAKTLVHELTHLVNRRSLGGNLPRWLSEGLADALGDTAKQLEEPPVPGAICLGYPNDCRGLFIEIFPDDFFPLGLGDTVNVVGSQWRRLVHDARDVAVINANRTAVDEALDSGRQACVEHIARSFDVYGSEKLVGHVHFVLCGCEMKNDVHVFAYFEHAVAICHRSDNDTYSFVGEHRPGLNFDVTCIFPTKHGHVVAVLGTSQCKS